MAKFPRFLTLPLAAVMIATACGGGGSQAPAGSAGGGASAPAASTGSGESPAAGGSQAAAGGSLNVLSLWGGSEETAFKAMLSAFTAKTGIQVKYEADRQTYATTLQSRITGGNPPDVAIIPGIGFLRRFAKDGSLKKISDLGIDQASLTQNYPAGFLAAGTVDGTLYALPAKYNNKGTMWFRPDAFKTANVTAPKTWDEFKAALTSLKDKPGAMALGAKDDWNLTDWFESIYIRQAGVDAYDKLFSKEGDWSDPSVQKTVDTMLEVVNDNYVVGGIDKAVGRAWTDAIAQVFKPTPDAAVFYEGGFVGGIAIGQTNKALKPGETIDWFPFPSFGGPNVTTFGGDVIGALTDTDQAKAFLQYMITPEANTAWASTGAIVSPNKGVGTDKYPNDLVVREAKSLTEAEQIRYDGSDLLPAGIQGENMGPLLQRAIKGEKIDWADFQSRVKAAWDAE